MSSETRYQAELWGTTIEWFSVAKPNRMSGFEMLNVMKHALVTPRMQRRSDRCASNLRLETPPSHLQNWKDDRSNSCGYIASLSLRGWFGSALGKCRWRFSANVLCSRDGRQ